MVLSDLHFGETEDSEWAQDQDQLSLALIDGMLDLEMPEFVAIDGDLITGDGEAFDCPG